MIDVKQTHTFTLSIGDLVDLYVALQEPGTPEVAPAEHRAQVSSITAEAVEFTLTASGDVVELPLEVILSVCRKVPPGGVLH